MNEKVKAPPESHVPEIISKLVTPQEAEMLLALPATPKELAERIGMDEDACKTRMDDWVSKGLVLSFVKDRQLQYFFARSLGQLSDATSAAVFNQPDWPVREEVLQLWERSRERNIELARERGIGFHTDACLGGFILPWAEKLGYDIPPFDFRLPGITSMSADTHKFGYALKGTSVVLYRGLDLRHYQYFKNTDWPGGVYFTPTFAGSRPGALSAVCWAAMVSTGEDGYIESTSKILEAAKFIKEGIEDIPELHILGDPLWVIAFSSKELDIYEIMQFMAEKNWNLNGLQNP